MRVRLALERDEDAVLTLVREAMAENRPWLTFDRQKAQETFRSYLNNADPTVFVVENDEQLVGLCVASIYEYRAASGLFILHEVFFVRPGHRGSRAAALLMKQLIAWSQSLGAKEVFGGNDSDRKSEKVAGFLEKFGFQRVGISMRKVL